MRIPRIFTTIPCILYGLRNFFLNKKWKLIGSIYLCDVFLIVYYSSSNANYISQVKEISRIPLKG